MKLQKKILTTAISSALLFSSLQLSAATEVEELRAQMQKLLERIDQLEEASVKTNKKVESVAAESQSSIFNVDKDKVRLSVSGHVNRGILFSDSGEHSSTDQVDNDASSSRIRFIGELDASPDLTLGTAIEYELDSNTSSRISQTNRDGDDERSTSFQNRRTELYLDSKSYGKLWVGLGWTASEDSSEQDLSGTNLAAYSSISDIGGGFEFENKDGSFSGIAVGDVNSNFDGLGRQNRLRYDTPTYSGFQFRTSLAENSAYDASVVYGGEFDFAKVVAAVSYADLGSESGEGGDALGDDQVNGSASILLNSGLSLTAAYGQQDAAQSGNEDPESYYVKLGYRTDLFSFGESAFSVDYSEADDVGGQGNEAESYGLQYVQQVSAWSTEFYAGYRRFELSNDATNVDYEDIDQVILGARVKF